MNNAKKEAIEVIGASKNAFLSTINLDNFPETRALENSLNKNLDERLEIYFATGTDSPKIEQLKRNSSASLYYYLEGSMRNMTLFGKLEVVTDKALKDKLWLDSFQEYYKNGKEDESYGILRFIPTGYKYYSHENGLLKNEGKF
jgi:general stress protein 26